MKIVIGVVVAVLVLMVIWMAVVYIGLGNDAEAATSGVQDLTSRGLAPGRS